MLSTGEYFHSGSSLSIHKAPKIEDLVENKARSLQLRKNSKSLPKVKENCAKEKKLFLCDFCNQSFDKKPRLSRHIHVRHKNKPENKLKVAVICDVESCKKTFRNKCHLDRHKKTVHDPNRPRVAVGYICNYCDVDFKKQDRLDRHIVSHTNEKTFRCNVEGCDKTYANRSHLNRHKKSAHEAKPEIAAVKCSQAGCQQMFTNKSNMSRHFKTHHVQLLPHSCSQCHEKFRRKLQLRKHEIKKHQQKHPFTCSQCNKGFLSSYTFTIHVATHQDEKLKRQCKSCGEMFAKWSQFVDHQRRFHKNDKRFTCDLCDKTFSRKPNIKIHMQVHSSTATIFQCHYDNCPKFYNAKRNLTSHIRSKHEGKRWQCDFCHREMSTMQKLKQHVSAHLDPKRAKLLKKTTALKLSGVEAETEAAANLFPQLESTQETSATELSDF